MPQLICPVCQAPLAAQANSWHCPQNHSFDQAREGYVNLLLVQQKKSLSPGDNSEMVLARRQFLHAGYYQPLRDAVCHVLSQLHANSLLDIGCGEGYYTHAFAELIPDTSGLDIAKPAVKLAAKRYPQICWLVASGAQLPVSNQSVDVVSSLFSPLPINEMARVLRPQGYAIVVTPAADHLWTLREALFGEVRAHEPDKFIPLLEQAFTIQQRLDVRFDLDLPQTALRDLVLMTPYAWKAKPERRQAVDALTQFKTTAAFSVVLAQVK